MGARLRKLLFFVIAMLIVLLVALLTAPLFVPAGLYKDQVIARIEQSTGRKLDIRGDIGLRFVPQVQLNMGDVRLSNPQGFGPTAEKDMISLQELQLSLGFIDLLRGKITIHQLDLVNPVIYLGRDAKGKENWVFEPQETPTPDSAASGTSKSATFKSAFSLPNMDITNGTLIYQATPDSEPLSLNKLNARIKMPSLHDQLTIHADTRLNDRLPATASMRFNTLAKWLDGEESDYTIEVHVDDKLLELTSEGKVNAQGDARKGLAVKGDMRLASSSLKKLSEGLGYPVLQDTAGEGKLGLRSMFNYEGDEAKLLGTTLSVDDAAISGSGSVAFSGNRPKIKADLTTSDILVLDQFIGRKKSSLAREQAASDEPATTEQKGAAKWSNEPLLEDVSALKTVDAAINMGIGGVKAGKVTLGAMKIATVLNNGAFSITIPDFSFYDGTAAVNASIQAQGNNGLRISKNATITRANLGQFLSDAYGFERLSGKGNLNIALNTQGISLQDFIGRLNGSGAFALENGAIKGFNLAEIVRDTRAIVKSVQDKTITADMQSTAAPVQTDFSSLKGSFTIAQGIISNPDLVMKAPLLNVTGSGVMNLPLQTVDYRLKPTLIGKLEGESRTEETSAGLTLPMRVTGSFDQLKFTPDVQNLIQDIAKDPKGTVENLEENVRGLRDDMKSLFKGL